MLCRLVFGYPERVFWGPILFHFLPAGYFGSLLYPGPPENQGQEVAVS